MADKAREKKKKIVCLHRDVMKSKRGKSLFTLRREIIAREKKMFVYTAMLIEQSPGKICLYSDIYDEK